jgi:5,10-methylenetetrahydrofolate reductase
MRVTADGLFSAAGQLEQHARSLSAHTVGEAPMPSGQSTADAVAAIHARVDAATAAHAERIWSVAAALSSAARTYADTDSSASAALTD